MSINDDSVGESLYQPSAADQAATSPPEKLNRKCPGGPLGIEAKYTWEHYLRALSMQTHQAPLQQRVLEIVAANLESFDVNRTGTCASFARDLHVDALEKIEFMVALETAFDIHISDLEAERIDTVQDAVDHVFFALNRRGQ